MIIHEIKCLPVGSCGRVQLYTPLAAFFFYRKGIHLYNLYVLYGLVWEYLENRNWKKERNVYKHNIQRVNGWNQKRNFYKHTIKTAMNATFKLYFYNCISTYASLQIYINNKQMNGCIFQPIEISISFRI